MTSHKSIQVALIGAGPLGINIYKYAIDRPDIQVTHVVDINPELGGKDMGTHSGLPQSGLAIQNNYEDLQGVHVAILATVSDMHGIAPQVRKLLGLGLYVVTTCEEMFYPWQTHPDITAELHELAIENNVAVLATGVNPGFLMDTLPSFMTGVCHHVEKIEVRRYQDAQFRRLPFQKKIGAGLSLEEFEDRKAKGILRHVGLTESMHFIAERLGWVLDETDDKVEPVIAERSLETEHMHLISGMVAGVRQTGRGLVNGEEKIRLIFQASIGEQDPYDEVEIFGLPHIRSRIMGGVHGDTATCSIILNACAAILKTQPGFRTMADIPMITSYGK